MGFNYQMPTKIISGADCIKKNSSVFLQYGKKALIVTGRKSATINGSEADVREALEAEGIECLTFNKIMSNPTIACTYEGAEVAKENKVDFVIAIGGGSPMDAAKVIAMLAAQDIKEENLFSKNYKEDVLPIIAVPTTAGTGSEVTQYSILTNDKLETKMSVSTPLIFPQIAFLDPKYMLSLSITNTINTAIDALSHAVEGMLSVRANTISDALAVSSIEMIMDLVSTLLKTKETNNIELLSLEIREKLLEASTLAGMVIAQTGTTVVHAMGYQLTYFKDVDHGRANGLLLGTYLAFVEQKKPELSNRVLKAMKVDSVKEFEESMVSLFGEREKITGEELINFSKKTAAKKNIPNSQVPPTEEEIKEMFEKAL
jgi:alcohol dehydrogenase class IV